MFVMVTAFAFDMLASVSNLYVYRTFACAGEVVSVSASVKSLPNMSLVTEKPLTNIDPYFAATCVAKFALL